MKSNSKSSAPCFTSNEAWPHSSVKALCGLSYTCFTGTRVLGQSGETGSKFLKLYARTHEKQPKVFGSLFHIKWDLALVSGPSVGRVIPASQELGYWGNLGKRVRIPKIMCKDTWKVIQSLQLLVSRQMRPGLTLVSKPSVDRAIPVLQVLGYWDNLGKLDPNPPNHMQGHLKSNPKSSAHCFTSNETLL